MLALLDNELDLARDEYLGIFNDTAIIQRKEKVDSEGGGQEDIITELGPYPVRIVDLRVNRPIEFPQGAQIMAIMTLEVIFPWDTPVKVDDVIRVIGKEIWFQVISHNGDRTDSLLLMANVVKRNEGLNPDA